MNIPSQNLHILWEASYQISSDVCHYFASSPSSSLPMQPQFQFCQVVSPKLPDSVPLSSPGKNVISWGSDVHAAATSEQFNQLEYP